MHIAIYEKSTVTMRFFLSWMYIIIGLFGKVIYISKHINKYNEKINKHIGLERNNIVHCGALFGENKKTFSKNSIKQNMG